MNNAFRDPQSLLVVGGTSDIALATARLLVRRRVRRVVLAARPSAALTRAADELRTAGAAVETVEFEATAVGDHEKTFGEAFARGDIDVVLVACGVLGTNALDPVKAAEIAAVTYVGAMSAALACANALREQGHGTLVVLSSVAAERPRRANFVYASAKAGLDAFAQGLTDVLHGSGVRVLVVRPGFVHTKMTKGLPPAPFATTPDAVAVAIHAGLRSQAGTIWVPGVLRPVMAVLRRLSRAIFRRLPG
ncbi:short-chain dehydrogenase [Acrocarpospora pleiomorpha]|uniref:Short-chain dehydrogenase n=1 Tax=Acrocarpospora pleiomorpha TaxID=90975 RepID=A0A5M3XES7_9ACTN|nr:SDR family NAD(P)-dependent oxidoreductase [Acrocarpospora pleiomorpha]GES19560.1 short-chain dehydrogenase [Acrocarpospora pleiomorpha]